LIMLHIDNLHATDDGKLLLKDVSLERSKA
jgi:hypothetical protein